MSFDAITAVLNMQVKPSSHKFVLFVMANFANEDWHSYPSIPAIAHITSLDRKTIISALHDLVTRGYLADTGARTGLTKQIPVYRVLPPESPQRNSTVSGTVPKTEQYRFSLETVPFFPGNSPKNGTRTQKDTKGHKRSDSSKKRPQKFLPEDFVITDALRDWAAKEVPGVDIEFQTAVMRDHEFKAPHTDWPKAWRNWMRRVPDFPTQAPTHAPAKSDHTGHRISNYPSGKYCHTCRREVLPRELIP